jgi:hypothetical protein
MAAKLRNLKMDRIENGWLLGQVLLEACAVATPILRFSFGRVHHKTTRIRTALLYFLSAKTTQPTVFGHLLRRCTAFPASNDTFVIIGSSIA